MRRVEVSLHVLSPAGTGESLVLKWRISFDFCGQIGLEVGLGGSVSEKDHLRSRLEVAVFPAIKQCVGNSGKCGPVPDWEVFWSSAWPRKRSFPSEISPRPTAGVN